MAVGDLVTTDFMLEYNGLVVGDDEDISLARVEGLTDLPSVRTADRTVLRRHGLHPGDDYLGGRSITLTLEVNAATDAALATRFEEVTAAYQVGAEQALVFQIPGVAGGGKRLVYARPRGLSAPIGLEWLYRLPIITVRFDASDPRLYAFTESSEADTLPTTEGGLEFNETPPLTFGAVSTGGLFECDNEGTFPTSPVIKLTGPVTNPRVTNVTTGQTTELELTVSSGDYVVLDAGARTVLLNGTASRYSSLASDSEWFDLEPGVNEIRYEASTTTSSAITVTFRSAWLG